MSRAVTWPMLTAKSGIDHYFKEIQRFPMFGPAGRIHAGQVLA